MRNYVDLCFAPILHEGKMRITRDFTRKLMEDMRANFLLALRMRRRDFTPLPAELLFLNRLQLGFYSVLARLGVDLEFNPLHRHTLGLVGETSRPKPPVEQGPGIGDFRSCARFRFSEAQPICPSASRAHGASKKRLAV